MCVCVCEREREREGCVQEPKTHIRGGYNGCPLGGPELFAEGQKAAVVPEKLGGGVSYELTDETDRRTDQ